MKSIYILQGKKTKTKKKIHYTGKTTRKPEVRLSEHLEGKTSWSKRHTDMKVIFFESWDERKVKVQLSPIQLDSDFEKHFKKKLSKEIIKKANK